MIGLLAGNAGAHEQAFVLTHRHRGLALLVHSYGGRNDER